MRQLVLALIIDGLLTQVKPRVKKTVFMNKIFRKIRTKISYEAKTNKNFIEAFELAEKTGRTVEATGKDYASISQSVKHLIEQEDWVIGYFKLNQKHLELFYRYSDSTSILFRSKQFANTILRCLDIEISYYNFNKENT